MRELARREAPDLVHLHNTHFQISPAAAWACRAAPIPVVQTLHNYRLVCPAATFLRAGRVCEDCVGHRLAWPAVLHGCYRGSRLASAGVAASLGVHRGLGPGAGASTATWRSPSSPAAGWSRAGSRRRRSR